MIGPIGSRQSFCTAYATDQGLRFRAGCFFGSSEALRAAVGRKHEGTPHQAEYLDWIELCEKWMTRIGAKS
jgi:hypothetical protein